MSLQDLGDLQSGLQPFGGKGGYVHGVVVKRSGGETKVFPVQQFRDVITVEPSLLQLANVGLHGEGLMATAHVDAADAEGHSRTDTGLPEWLVGPERGLSGLKFDANAIIASIA